MKKSFFISLAAGLTPIVISILITGILSRLQMYYVILLLPLAIILLFAHKDKGIGLGLLVSFLIIIISFFVYIIITPISFEV